MKDEIEKGALERVSDARYKISEKFNHDPKKLIEYYMDLQQLYKSRLVDSEEKQNKQPA